MLHRTKIRELAVKLLRENAEVKSLVGGNIKDSKVSPFEGNGLPGINVVTPSQNGVGNSLSILSVDNVLKLNIEIYVQALDGYQRKADDIAEAVEKALLCNTEFCRLTSQLQNYDIENSIYDQGAQPIVVQILSFTLNFRDSWEPVIEDKLSRVDIDVDVIEPIADPAPGPDGRKEFRLKIETGEE